MNCGRLTVIMMVILFSVSSHAANAFLDAPDDQPVSVKFRGMEWSDDIGSEDIPLAATVVTTRIAKMPWGAIFKIEFTDLKSRAEKQREIRPDYFIVTDDRIVLLNEEDNDAATKKISALDKPPEFEPDDIYGITSGNFEHQEGEWKRQLNLKATGAFMRRPIPRDISKKLFGKKELD
jgi:hypothetical protein